MTKKDYADQSASILKDLDGLELRGGYRAQVGSSGWTGRR